jgi:hypothetical protein
MIKLVNIARVLYQVLRGLSVNIAGQLSILYRYLYSCLEPLQHSFDTFSTARTKQLLLSQCKWEFGQATWVLNELYDKTLRRIVITKPFPVLNYFYTAATPDVPSWDNTAATPTVPLPYYENTAATTSITGESAKVWIPAALYSDAAILSDITASVNKLVPQGILVTINSL